MKKLYIIITNTLYGFGGGQLLTLRKARYLKKLGYNVIIVYKAKYGEYRLEGEFSEFQCLYVPEFGKPYNFVTKKNRELLMKKMVGEVGEYSLPESYIESHDTQTAVWGDLLSSRLKIPHFLYLILETNMNRLHYYPYKRFYSFKLKRNELLGCNSRCLDLSFNELLLDYRNNYINVCFDETEIKEESSPRFPFPIKSSEQIIISTVTRVDKVYLLNFIELLETLCIDHPEKEFQLRIIGGTVYPEIWNNLLTIIDRINIQHNNLQAVVTGYMIPGKDVFLDTDIFVGTGTAVINAISQKCITIPYNSYTNKTPGIFGVESKNFAYPEVGSSEYDVKEKILEIIKLSEEERREYKELAYSFYLENYSMEGTWRKFMQLSERIPRDGYTYSFKYAKLFIIFDILFLFATTVRDFFFRKKI